MSNLWEIYSLLVYNAEQIPQGKMWLTTTAVLESGLGMSKLR